MCGMWKHINQDYEIRTYANALYLLGRVDAGHVQASGRLGSKIECNEKIPWRYGTLHFCPADTGDVHGFPIIPGMCLQQRMGGEQVVDHRGVVRKVKDLLQANGITPWRRQCFPLLYLNEKLVCVPGAWCDEEIQADANALGAQWATLEWS